MHAEEPEVSSNSGSDAREESAPAHERRTRDCAGKPRCRVPYEHKRNRRTVRKYRSDHVFRARLRNRAYDDAFRQLRTSLPTLPFDKKLSNIETLRLAICYIKHMKNLLKVHDRARK